MSIVTYHPNFVSEPQKVFAVLQSELNWEKRPDAPRMEYWTNSFARPYTYGSGRGVRTYESQPIHPVIAEIRDNLTGLLGFEYEGCFLNLYNGARDHLGWHADDDAGINHTRPIAVVTVGAGRLLQIKSQEPGSLPQDWFLEAGSLLLMHAGMQSTHYHRIPKAGCEVEPRISLTFRSLNPLAQAVVEHVHEGEEGDE